MGWKAYLCRDNRPVLSLEYIQVFLDNTAHFNCAADLPQRGSRGLLILYGVQKVVKLIMPYFMFLYILKLWQIANALAACPPPLTPHSAIVYCPSLWHKCSSTEIPRSFSVARLAVQGNVPAVRDNADGHSLSFPQVFRTRLCMRPRLPRVFDGGTKRRLCQTLRIRVSPIVSLARNRYWT